ncbi:MAG: hypothetical protein P8X94_03595, partial [Woeseiaceae bacterium]
MDARVLLDDDDRFVAWRRMQRFRSREFAFGNLVTVERLPGPVIVLIATAPQEPEQDAACKNDRRADLDPPAAEEAHDTVHEARLTDPRRTHVVRRCCRLRLGRCVVGARLPGRHFVGIRLDLVFGQQVIVGRCRRLIDFAANIGEFLAQGCQLVVTYFDQRLRVGHVGRFQLGNALDDLLLARRRFRRRIGIVGEIDPGRFLVRRYERQAGFGLRFGGSAHLRLGGDRAGVLIGSVVRLGVRVARVDGRRPAPPLVVH